MRASNTSSVSLRTYSRTAWWEEREDGCQSKAHTFADLTQTRIPPQTKKSHKSFSLRQTRLLLCHFVSWICDFIAFPSNFHSKLMYFYIYIYTHTRSMFDLLVDLQLQAQHCKSFYLHTPYAWALFQVAQSLHSAHLECALIIWRWCGCTRTRIQTDPPLIHYTRSSLNRPHSDAILFPTRCTEMRLVFSKYGKCCLFSSRLPLKDVQRSFH